MDPQKLRIEFSEELRGKNAANFWIGVGVVFLAVWLWWNGWFSTAADFLGFEAAKPADGDGLGSTSGAVSMLVDTLCLIGLVTTAIVKFCWRFIGGLSERLGFVSSGVLSWAARERAEVTPDRTLEALRSHEERLRELELMLFDEDPLTELDDPQSELEQANNRIAELQREVNQLRQQAADVQAARERQQIVSGGNASAPAPAQPQA